MVPINSRNEFISLTSKLNIGQYDFSNYGILSRTQKQNLLAQIDLLDLKNLPKNCLPFGHVNTAGLLHTYEKSNISRLDIIQTFLLLNSVMIFSVCETHLHENQVILDNVHQFYDWIDYPRVTGAAWGGSGVFVHRSLQIDDK